MSLLTFALVVPEVRIEGEGHTKYLTVRGIIGVIKPTSRKKGAPPVKNRPNEGTASDVLEDPMYLRDGQHAEPLVPDLLFDVTGQVRALPPSAYGKVGAVAPHYADVPKLSRNRWESVFGPGYPFTARRITEEYEDPVVDGLFASGPEPI